MCARKVMAFITLSGSRTMDRQDCEYFGLSHYKEKRGEYANTFNTEAKITAFAKARKHRAYAAALRLGGLQPLIWRLVTNYPSQANNNSGHSPCTSLIRPSSRRPWPS
ncbi:hypothetical protein ALP05_100599 [Pseudomonas caricapapayae]|uniref:Uncharacterized protein n=2 Tax=Pseudomonas caricapapayae TaxID=46678 RepID=A0A3M6EK08_9PSED|nr:hypothetical protein ALP05_100599 [Pseudomonas caricapapayae]